MCWCNSLSVKACGHNRESASLNVISTLSFHSLWLWRIRKSILQMFHLHFCGLSSPTGSYFKYRAGICCTSCEKSNPEGNVAPNPRQWTPRSLTFEPVVRVALALTVVICWKTWDRHDGSLPVRGQFLQTCAYVTWETQQERYVGGGDTNIYSLICPVDKRNKENPYLSEM